MKRGDMVKLINPPPGLDGVVGQVNTVLPEVFGRPHEAYIVWPNNKGRWYTFDKLEVVEGEK
jgi:hypothetical protein